MMTCSMPAATASSTAYWMTGLSTSGSISLGWAFVAGRNRVPQPAAGKTAFRTRIEPRVRAGWNGRPRIPSAPLRAVEGGSPPVPAGRSGVRGWLFLRACDGAGEPPDHPREGLRPVEVRHVRGAADDDAARVRGNVRERPLRRPEEDVVLAVDQEARSRV